MYIVYHRSRFQTNSAAVIAYLGTKSRFVTNDNKLRVVGVPCSFYILHELVKSEIVGLEFLCMMVLTCKVLTATSNGCHIFFDSMPNLTALSFYTSNSKRIFYCSEGTIECTLPTYLYGQFPAKGTL